MSEAQKALAEAKASLPGAPPLHIKAREKMYPGKGPERFYVEDKFVPWEVSRMRAGTD